MNIASKKEVGKKTVKNVNPEEDVRIVKKGLKFLRLIVRKIKREYSF